VPLPAGTAAVLLDVEGTTTSIAFVYDVLFPYVVARLEAYCSRTAPEPELAAALARLKAEYDAESREAVLPPAAPAPAMPAG
jgi:enolase-phosphatase E1